MAASRTAYRGESRSAIIFWIFAGSGFTPGTGLSCSFRNGTASAGRAASVRMAVSAFLASSPLSVFHSSSRSAADRAPGRSAFGTRSNR